MWIRTQPKQIAVMLLLAAATVAVAQDYEVAWHTIDGGGGYSLGGDFQLEGTIGQADAGGPINGGEYSLSGGFWSGLAVADAPADDVSIVDAESILPHGDPAIDLAVRLEVTGGIEPRLGGPRRLSFDMDQEMDPETVTSDNVQVACAMGPAPNIVGAVLSGANTVVVDIEAMEPLDCCMFAFAGMRSDDGGTVADTYNVRRIEGDLDHNGGVTGGDAAIIKPNFGQIAGVDLADPQWDFDRNGGVTGGDFSLIKPLLGDVGAICP